LIGRYSSILAEVVCTPITTSLFVVYDPNGLIGKSVSQTDVPFARHMQIIFYGFAASVKAVIEVICVDPCEAGV